MGLKLKRPLFVVALLVILPFLIISCGEEVPLPLPMISPTATPTPSPPKAENTAKAFLGAWERGDYEAMYQLLSTSAKSATTREYFVKRYRNITAEATITSVKTSIASVEESGSRAQVGYTVTMETILVGQVEGDNVMPLTLEEDRWGVDWSPSLIFKELWGDNLIHMFDEVPARGNIYYRDGQALAMEGIRVLVGVVPDWIKDEERLLAELSLILGLDAEAIKAKYATAARPDWFMPVKELSFEEFLAHRDILESLSGVALREKRIRTYPHGSAVAHVAGYVGEIDAQELAQLAARGYQEGDVVGKMGLERWGEAYLAGQREGILSVITPEGNVVDIIKKQPAKQSRSIHTTLDPSLQGAAEEALGDQVGAIVALDPHTGEVLAMVSHPAFDPNAMALGLSADQWQALLGDLGRPLVNRATQGIYPPGSVFKIVTMAAAMEKANFDVNTTIDCTGTWTGLGAGWTLKDWAAHGQVSLLEALVQSCNVFFAQAGKQLYDTDPAILPGFAHQFGLGQPTGLEVLDEASGLVPSPQTGLRWVGDSVNMAIGQGDLLVTPLQIANLLAAVGNGGTLYRPRLVSRIAASPEEEEVAFEPEEVAKLPLSPANLQIIQGALAGVTSEPQGTAHEAFHGFAVPVAGKTGTAENPAGKPHAWFAGYAPADEPRIAMAVVIEHGGEGPYVAAPIFRQVLEVFFKEESSRERKNSAHQGYPSDQLRPCSAGHR